MMVDKERVHEAVDKLSPQNLAKVSEYIEALSREEGHEDWFGKIYDLSRAGTRWR